jgi:hypothetical protein
MDDEEQPAARQDTPVLDGGYDVGDAIPTTPPGFPTIKDKLQ